ncbi:Structural maintenance of chromosomes protein 5 [Hypsibius exemplaris]|uniref:Structural maintenance of chromosomes protein 5 n=1 Tax=Hypsibius exemplaris TaxID=2072580 RepID=A0A1W0WY82_HYPEX|nr:Structural maintenance of chromosomes protein 5 [Hypsibius exemplaris]
MEEFPRGTITKIELHNFMTYDHVISWPGPKINFILGRNGSGKSSVVCAIALCCGSSPSFIGRSSTLQDFIKHGQQTASVELTLSNPGGAPVVIRRILRRSKSNDCFFNGKLVKMEEYLEKIKEMNIMTDNLVQFLPQERVIDFSLMSPVQLLENTEKTIGELNLTKLHRELIEKGNQWENAGQEIERLRRALGEAQDKLVQLKQDVEALDVREDIVIQMRLAALRKDRLEILKQQADLRLAKGVLENLLAGLEVSSAIVVPFQKQMVKGKVASNNATRALLEAKREIEAEKNRFDSAFFESEPDNLQKENAHDLGVLKGSKKGHEDRLTKVKNFQTAIQNLETQRTDTDVPALKAIVLGLQQEQIQAKKQSEAANARKLQTLSERRQLDDKLQSTMMEIARIENSEDGLTKYLKEHDNLSYRAREWLKQNAAKLRGTVHGPIYAEIRMKTQDKRHADIVGINIPPAFQTMFICEEEADLDLILKEMVQQASIRIPVRSMARGTRQSFIDPNAFKQRMECPAVVSDLFDAPDAVKRFLNNKFRMENIPVYDQSMDGAGFDRLKNIVANGGQVIVPIVFAGPTIYKFRTTRMNSNIASSSQPITEQRAMRELMTANREKPDVAPLTAALDQLRNALEELKTVEQTVTEQVAAAQSKFAQVSAQIQAHKGTIADAEKISNRIRTNTEELRKLEAAVQAFSIEAEQEKTAAKIRERNLKSWKKIRLNSAGATTRNLDKTINLTIGYMKSHTESRDRRLLKTNLTKMWTDWLQYRTGMVDYQRDFRRMMDNLTGHVHLIRDVPGSSNGRLSADALKLYLELPATIPQLDAIHKSKRNQLNAAGDVNENARKDLEKHEAATEKLEHTIATHNDSIAKEKERFAKLKQKWMDTIQELVGKIGQSFSHFYRKMSLAGDVILQHPDNPDHFEKYGFAIKVSYRPNRPLETLSGQVHSGGEKSVATALYMLAIQELTKCPFRVVDEINQGMDAENERRVFKMIVETAGRCGGQYFILSPKLLPDLHLTRDVAVTVILSGTEMHSGSDLDAWQLTKIARTLKSRSPSHAPVPSAGRGVAAAVAPPDVKEQSRSRKRTAAALEEADEDRVEREAAQQQLKPQKQQQQQQQHHDHDGPEGKVRKRSKKLATLN